MDAIDIAATNFSQTRPQLLACANYPIPSDLRDRVRRLQTERCHLSELMRLDYQFGRLFANSLNDFITRENLNPDTVSAIGLHGQTVLHQLEEESPLTLQIGDPNLVAYATGIVVVSDFRRADIAAGGQGAPLAPALHALAFGEAGKQKLVVNVGGIANITVLDGNRVIAGFDTGPGNCLIDAWSRNQRNQPVDYDGQWAAAHSPNASLLRRLLDDSFFHKKPPKSACASDFSLDWLENHLSKNNAINSGVVVATLTELTAVSIAEAIKDYPNNGHLLVCGGGVHNTYLMERLELHTRLRVTSTADAGLNPDWVEAILLAWLAKLRLENRSGVLPATTGADQAAVLGALYETSSKN